VLVGEDALASVREGARVGTSALRRRAQLLAARPDLEVCEIRGNVDTRLAKRAAGEVDVLVLAAAGLERLHRRGEAGALLHEGVFVPAAGQGVIAIQARAGSPAASEALRADHATTHEALDAERFVVRELEATCHTPVGVLATREGVSGFVGLPDGSEYLFERASTAEGLAKRLLAAGAIELLRALTP
jgi:hydroxymethylbilane synthase